MINLKLFVAVLTFLLSSTFAVYAQEARESAPAVSPDIKQDGKQEASQAAKPAANHEGKDHSAMKEKRYVAAVWPDGVQRVEITGGAYYFDPNHIIVKVNVPVEFKVKKEKGFVPHDILVKAPEAGIDFKVDLSNKDVKTVKFTPTKVGTYEMICDKKLPLVKSHKDKGMKGIIEVVQ